jgi:hypothetical protein
MRHIKRGQGGLLSPSSSPSSPGLNVAQQEEAGRASSAILLTILHQQALQLMVLLPFNM